MEVSSSWSCSLPLLVSAQDYVKKYILVQWTRDFGNLTLLRVLTSSRESWPSSEISVLTKEQTIQNKQSTIMKFAEWIERIHICCIKIQCGIRQWLFRMIVSRFHTCCYGLIFLPDGMETFTPFSWAWTSNFPWGLVYSCTEPGPVIVTVCLYYAYKINHASLLN